MKIIKFEVVHVRPRYSFLKVHTDDNGIVGIGEACLEGKARVVEAALREFVKLQVERFAALREAVGDDVDIAIDFHGRVAPALAGVLIAELAPLSPLFVEEPCLPENVEMMARLARPTPVPIATGERLFTKWGFREVLEKGAGRAS